MDRVGEIYTQRMRWVGAAGYYFFVSAYFEGLASPLGPALRLFVVLAYGSVACADLFVVRDGSSSINLVGRMTITSHLRR